MAFLCFHWYYWTVLKQQSLPYRRHDQCSNGLSVATSRNCNRKAMLPGMINRSKLIYKILLSLLCDIWKHPKIPVFRKVAGPLSHNSLGHPPFLITFECNSAKNFFFERQFPPISLTWKHHIYSQFPHIKQTAVSSILAIYPKRLTFFHKLYSAGILIFRGSLWEAFTLI